MAKGDFYPVYTELRIYSDSDRAKAYGSNYASTIYPNTGSDSGTYQAISSVEGKGNAYVDTSWGLHNPHYPAFPVWWVPDWGGSGYLIGWTNDEKNGFPLYVGNSSNKPVRAKALYVGNSSNKPVKVLGLWVGDSSSNPRKAK